MLVSAQCIVLSTVVVSIMIRSDPTNPNPIVDWNIHLGLLAEPSRDGRARRSLVQTPPSQLESLADAERKYLSGVERLHRRQRRDQKGRIAPEAPTLAVTAPCVGDENACQPPTGPRFGLSWQSRPREKEKIAVTVEACRLLPIYTFC
jgi:hypothetical protein